MNRHAGISLAIALLLQFAVGCATFTLSDHLAALDVKEHPRPRNATLLVLPFDFAPADPGESGRLTERDLARWQQLLASGLDRANIADSVIASPNAGIATDADYTLGGRITRFEFQKRWVPTLVPIHLGLSFLTLTAYTLLGGSTASTVVHFSVAFELADARSGELIRSFEEDFSSRRKLNIYSEAAEDPYENPGRVFSRVVESAAAEIAGALP